ncbi:MAG: GNAT family N-acetyltransferase [Proteobacteria bacterium]|nr:GNAT family N-acetyltransferase [Pseudomonadota bacterium]
MITSPTAWGNVGGNSARFALYAQLGTARGFADDSGRCLATIHPALPHVGALGDWVGGPGPRQAAERWLREQGCTVLRGPMELCTHFSYRASLGPAGDAPFFLEPTEPAQRWIEAGYAPAAHYVSDHADLDALRDNGEAAGERLKAEGWTCGAWGSGGLGTVTEADYRAGVTLVHRLTEASFLDAYSYAPVPEEALQALYAPLRPLVDPRIVLFATAPDGIVGGFFFGLPDASRPGRFLLKTLAVDPIHRRKGLGAWLTGELARSALAAGYTEGIAALMADTSHSLNLSAYGGSLFRRYALLEKTA